MSNKQSSSINITRYCYLLCLFSAVTMLGNIKIDNFNNFLQTIQIWRAHQPHMDQIQKRFYSTSINQLNRMYKPKLPRTQCYNINMWMWADECNVWQGWLSVIWLQPIRGQAGREGGSVEKQFCDVTKTNSTFWTGLVLLTFYLHSKKTKEKLLTAKRV